MLIKDRKPLKHFINKKINEFLTKNLKLKHYLKIRHYLIYIQNRNALKKVLKEKRNQKQMQFPSKIAIIFLGTNNYIKYFPNYYLKIKKLFLPNIHKDFFVFTNQINYPFLTKKDVIVVKIKHEKYPMLKSFKYIKKASKKLKKYDYVIWIDADLQVNTFITQQEFFPHNKPLFGVQHPNFIKTKGNFEYNQDSSASVKEDDDLSVYIQACFWGGKSNYLLKLVAELKKRIELDLKNNVIAKVQDESHLNKYFVENKNLFYVHNPSYAYPKNRPIPKPFKKKIIHAAMVSKSGKFIKGEKD